MKNSWLAALMTLIGRTAVKAVSAQLNWEAVGQRRRGPSCHLHASRVPPVPIGGRTGVSGGGRREFISKPVCSFVLLGSPSPSMSWALGTLSTLLFTHKP